MDCVHIFRNFRTLGQIRYFNTKIYRLKEINTGNSSFRNDLQHCYCFNNQQSHKSRNYTMEVKQKETFMIAGLGNHDYSGTRHSVGMHFVNRLAQFLDMKPTKNKDCLGFVAEKELSYINLVLLKPKQAMNINGASVYKTAKKHKVPVSNIFIVHDDLEKKVGKVAIKEKGSPLGHNGVKSVIQSFKTETILRVRIGIDRPASRDMVSDYVLSKFKPDEMDKIDEAINQAVFKVAQRIGAQVEQPASNIFRMRDDSDDNSSQSSDTTNNSTDVT